MAIGLRDFIGTVVLAGAGWAAMAASVVPAIATCSALPLLAMAAHFLRVIGFVVISRFWWGQL